MAGATRVVLVVGLFVALVWAAVQGVLHANEATETGRLADRQQVTQAVAASAGARLDAGVKEATALAADTAQGGPGAAVERDTARPHTLPEAVVVDRPLHPPPRRTRPASPDNSRLAP